MVPSPGIVIALHEAQFSAEAIRAVAANHEGVKKFIVEDSYAPDCSIYDVFLCYASADFPRADTLRNALRQAGLRCFMAEKTLEAGDLWSEEIREALVGAREMCILCTPTAVKSEWVLT